MIDIINEITKLGPGTIIICIVLVASLVISGKTLWGNLLNAMDLKTGKSLREKELNDRLDKMDRRISDIDTKVNNTYKEMYDKQKLYHEQSVNIRSELKDNQKDLSDKLTHLTKNLGDFIIKDDEKTVSLFRSSLWKMHKDFVDQGFVTPDGLKTFMEMGKIYERCGGNDIYHEKLLPEVSELEIHYPDGSIYVNKK